MNNATVRSYRTFIPSLAPARAAAPRSLGRRGFRAPLPATETAPSTTYSEGSPVTLLVGHFTFEFSYFVMLAPNVKCATNKALFYLRIDTSAIIPAFCFQSTFKI